jgi:glutathione synthase/RimK-type ligase-like ATP-grasp enzyme
VVNGPRALGLEISKVRQYEALEAAGVAVPRTVLVLGEPGRILAAAREHFCCGPLILKPNRRGTGLGVRLFPHAPRQGRRRPRAGGRAAQDVA